jgi:CRISPR/Cas system endoribonuclease Cas6 (RAMP superfamily)
MRIKINLKLERIPFKDLATESARALNKALGANHKWHDLSVKPYTCSLINGGIRKGDDVVFNKSAFICINTEDDEVIEALFSDKSISFSIVNNEVFKDYNILSVYNVIYNKSGKGEIFVTEENKQDFVEYVKNKYLVEIEILKIKNSRIPYKKNGTRPVSNLLIKCNGNKNVENLFESGIGGSCSIGFGFVEQINKKR